MKNNLALAVAVVAMLVLLIAEFFIETSVRSSHGHSKHNNNKISNNVGE